MENLIILVVWPSNYDPYFSAPPCLWMHRGRATAGWAVVAVVCVWPSEGKSENDALPLFRLPSPADRGWTGDSVTQIHSAPDVACRARCQIDRQCRIASSSPTNATFRNVAASWVVQPGASLTYRVARPGYPT